MKIFPSVILALCFLFLIVACEKNVDEKAEPKIPIDSLNFSCKINGELITLKSSSVTSGSEGAGYSRLFKMKNSAKDSAVVSYFKSYTNKDIRLTIGISKIFLVDTTYHFYNKDAHNYKNEIFDIGTYICQYKNPELESDYVSTSIISQVEGFYMKIEDLKTGITYTSYPRYITDYSKAKYDEFKSLGSFRITKSIPLNSGIYSDYRNAWFREATLNCKLYESNEETNNSISLTDGVLSGVF